MKKMTTMIVFALALTGCASSVDNPITRAHEFKPVVSKTECINAKRQMRDFEVLSSSQVQVNYGRHQYIVTTYQCSLEGTDRLSFSQGPEKMTYLGHQRLYVTQLHTGKICGGGMDRLVVRKTGEDFSMPGRNCVISSVQKIER